MMLIRLTYFSRSRLDHWYRSRDCGITEVLATSVANNRRDGITGVLLCDDRWFVQTLEGIESKVSAAFERILRDQRHRDVSLVAMQPAAERRFQDFAMACVVRDEDNAPLFRHYAEGDCFDPRQMRPDRLSDLIEAVVPDGTAGGPGWTRKNASTAA